MVRILRSLFLAALAPACLVPAAAAQGPFRAPALPPIPHVDGPLVIRVVYPPEGALLTARDSGFVFGSVGSGDATLTINGQDVAVSRNGAFLAWLPLEGDSVATWRIVARRGADSVMAERHARLPLRPIPPGGLWIDAASLAPRGERWAERGEPIRVSVRASAGATVVLRLPSGDVALAPVAAFERGGTPFDVNAAPLSASQPERYVGVFPAEPLGGALPSVTAPRVPAQGDTAQAEILATRDADTARAPLPLRLTLVDPAHPRVVVLDDDTARTGRTRGAAVGMPMPGGAYDWFFVNGTVAAVDGRSGDVLRLRLSSQASAWVSLGEVGAVMPEGTPPPFARVALVRLSAAEPSVVARVSLSARIPFRVEETERALTLRLYGAQSDLDWLQYGSTDSLVRRMTASQVAGDEVTVTLELSRPLFGWRARWDGTDLLLEIRRPPAIDPRRPLRGRVIVVDPGHPPLGATGPTGLTEAEANLGVGLALRRLLEAAGARVVMTRTDSTPLELYPRTSLAEQVNADLLVSIHNNAFPDGVNPFENNGTSTYYFHPRDARLAFLVQQALLSRLGLRDIGYGRGNLALVRPTWMPAVLTEGAFLMVPEQENALRTREFQERYARGVMEGVAAWLRELATQP